MRRLATTLKWTVFALVVGLVLLEGVLRLAGAYLTRKFDASQKSAQQQDCVTILALGESTTGGVWLESSQSYPGQLQRLLTQRYGRPVPPIGSFLPAWRRGLCPARVRPRRHRREVRWLHRVQGSQPEGRPVPG